MLSNRIDTFINFFKWPCALLATAALPGAVVACVTIVRGLIAYPRSVWPLLLGIAIFTALYLLLFRRPRWGRFFSTFEHELTHALFAWVTLHRVIGFKATMRSGGEVRFTGRGNWLITASPYFFPTWCVLLAPFLLLPHPFVPWVQGLIGAALAYHVCSTIQETHRRQTDLKKLRLLFVILFLPGANVIALGLVLATASGGLSAAGAFIEQVWLHAMYWLRALVG